MLLRKLINGEEFKEVAYLPPFDESETDLNREAAACLEKDGRLSVDGSKFFAPLKAVHATFGLIQRPIPVREYLAEHHELRPVRKPQAQKAWPASVYPCSAVIGEKQVGTQMVTEYCSAPSVIGDHRRSGAKVCALHAPRCMAPRCSEIAVTHAASEPNNLFLCREHADKDQETFLAQKAKQRAAEKKRYEKEVRIAEKKQAAA